MIVKHRDGRTGVVVGPNQVEVPDPPVLHVAPDDNPTKTEAWRYVDSNPQFNDRMPPCPPYDF